MKVLLLFDDIDMGKNNSITAKTYPAGNHKLSTVKINGISDIRLSVEDNSLLLRVNNDRCEIYNEGLDNQTHLIILSHWCEMDRACSRLFFNNSEISYKNQCLQVPSLKGYWNRVHSDPKVLVCKGKFEGMSTIIRIFDSNDNETIDKLAGYLEEKKYERK
jgi:hypothetical protein